MTRGLRRVLIGAGVVALAFVLVVVVAVYLLLQPDRFTTLLQNQAEHAGLTLNLASPASPSLFPRPSVELRGITLSAQNADSPILLASRGRLVLPWSSLLGGHTAIARMQVDAPRVDLGALQDWLASLPPQPADAPRSIPRIDAGISIGHGNLVNGNSLLLGNIALETGTLAPDQPFPLDMSAVTSSGALLHLRLAATPHMQGNALLLNDIQVHLAQGDTSTLALTGNARWHGAADASAQLGGKLDQANSHSYDVALTLTPANQTSPLLLHFKLDGADNHIDLRLPPLALAEWWNTLDSAPGELANPQLSLPPGDGSLRMATLQIGNLRAEGLTIQAGSDAPAAASTASAPAQGNPGKRSKAK